jgi:phenylacetate-CoA ligase
MDNMEVRCELQRECSGLNAGDRAAVANELVHRIKTHIGISVKITLLDVDSIPRTLVGKARRVIDERHAHG